MEMEGEMGDDRRPTYLETRVREDGVEETVRIWRASSLGACDRSLMMHAMGNDAASTPDVVQRAYDAGTDMERTILDGMKRGFVRNGGWRELDRHELHAPYNRVVEVPGREGVVQVELEIECGKWKGVRQIVRLHPDAFAVKVNKLLWDGETGAEEWGEDDNGTRVVVEAKFLGRGTYGGTPEKVLERSRFYQWQVSCEMVASGLDCLLLIGWKKKKVEGEENAHELDELETPYVVREPPFTRGQIMARVLGLARMIERVENEGMGVVECDWAMYPCPFYDTHDGQKVHAKKGGDEGEWFEGISEEDQKSITYWAGKYEAARMKRDAADRERKEAGKKLGEVVERLGWVGGKEGAGARVAAGWKIERVWNEAKEARMVEHKATSEFEYVKVSRIKGSSNDENGE